MTQIIMQKCDDGAIWVTSDEDQIGIESRSVNLNNERLEFVSALYDFLHIPMEAINVQLIKEGYEE